jgi:hypothetical protein
MGETLKINKFWAKMKLMFVGISIMSMITFWILLTYEYLNIEISTIIFLAVSSLSMIIALYSNHRRLNELKQETK